jgi:hypothetical protein
MLVAMLTAVGPGCGDVPDSYGIEQKSTDRHAAKEKRRRRRMME